MQAISVINLFPETKEQINTFVNLVVESVNEGTVNALELSIKLKALEVVCDEIRKQISDSATSEACKYGEKSFDHKNAKVEVAMVGVKYDYSCCCDAEWNELNKEIETATLVRKEREKFLKNIKGQMTVVNEITGEVDTIYAPKVSGKESIKITLK